MNHEHWAAYYRGGALVSCPTNPEPGYEGRVRQAWEDYFAALPATARVLDIGTGNGPVALLASTVSTANGLDLRITGVDLADIDPVRDVSDGEQLFAGIEFRGGVSTEALPFDEATFDAISGQYIAEYTDTAATLAEIARVLAPGGRLRLILHHAHSVVVTNARESLRHAALVTDEALLAKAAGFFASNADSGEAARQALIASGKRLEGAAEESHNPILLDFVLRSITTLLEHRNRLTADQVATELERLTQELDLWQRRLDDLAGAALDEQAIHALAGAAEAAGLAGIEYEPLYQAGDVLVGWLLDGANA